MLSVAVHKDLGEYKPKLIGKLTTRTLISIIGAVAIAILTSSYIYFILGMNPADCQIVIMSVTIPFWLCGFYRPKGLPFEKFLPLWFQHTFTDNKIFYKSMPELLEETKKDTKRKELKKHDKSEGKFRKLRGIEAYSPKLGKVV